MPRKAHRDLVGSTCGRCGAAIIHWFGPADATGSILCPACAAEDLAAVRIGAALRIHLAAEALRRETSDAKNRRVRRRVRAVAADLEQLAEQLAASGDDG